MASLLAPWPGTRGDVAGQWRTPPVGAVRPRSASPVAAWPDGRVGAVPNAPAETPRRRHRDPFLAGVLSVVVPGLGHVYAGEPWRGLAVFLVAEGAMVTALKAEDATVRGLTGTIGFGAYLYGIMEAPIAASRYNDRHPPPAIP